MFLGNGAWAWPSVFETEKQGLTDRSAPAQPQGKVRPGTRTPGGLRTFRVRPGTGPCDERRLHTESLRTQYILPQGTLSTYWTDRREGLW